MIIFRPKKADQTQGKDVIVYRDFSLRKRIENTPKVIKEQAALKKRTSKIGQKKEDEKKEEEIEP